MCIGSDAGKVGERLQSMYGATKAAMMSFAKCVAKEHSRDGICINVVSSGVAKTGIQLRSGWLAGREETLVKAYPLGRLGETQDVVDALGVSRRNS